MPLFKERSYRVNIIVHTTIFLFLGGGCDEIFTCFIDHNLDVVFCLARDARARTKKLWMPGW